jgi:hypothetical protein
MAYVERMHLERTLCVSVQLVSMATCVSLNMMNAFLIHARMVEPVLMKLVTSVAHVEADILAKTVLLISMSALHILVQMVAPVQMKLMDTLVLVLLVTQGQTVLQK